MLIIKLKQDAQVVLTTFEIKTSKAVIALLKKIGFWEATLGNFQGHTGETVASLLKVVNENLAKAKDSATKAEVAQGIDALNRNLLEYPNAIFESEVVEDEEEVEEDDEKVEDDENNA